MQISSVHREIVPFSLLHIAASQAQQEDPYTPVVLRNKNGVQADILPIGATIHRLLVPDKNGQADDVVLGFDDPKTYQVHNFWRPLLLCMSMSGLITFLHSPLVTCIRQLISVKQPWPHSSRSCSPHNLCASVYA